MKYLMILAAFAALPATAATVTPGDPVAGGIGYRWTVALGASDAATFDRHVGAWSWEDNSLFNAGIGEPPVGWTHTSDWVALTLDAATVFTLKLERQAGVSAPTAQDPNAVAGSASMFPSFTIWAGWDNDDGDNHTYNNRGNVDWAEDLVYLDHVDNSTVTAVERTWALAAGQYSIVLGSNAPATDTQRQGYRATLTTVPEPGVGVLAAVGGLVALRRRRA